MERGIDPGKERGAFETGQGRKGPGLCGGYHGRVRREDWDPGSDQQ